MTVIRPLLAATALIAAISGCSVQVGGSGLDVEKLKAELSSSVKSVTGSEQADVSCPSDIPLAKGTAVTCTVTIAGQPATFTVTQTDDQGTVQYERKEAIVDLSKVKSEIQPQIEEKLTGSWDITCSPQGQTKYLVIPPGATFECSVSGQADSGDSLTDQPLKVTVKDVDGNVSWSL